MLDTHDLVVSVWYEPIGAVRPPRSDAVAAAVVEWSAALAFALWCWIWRTLIEVFAAGQDRSEHPLLDINFYL